MILTLVLWLNYRQGYVISDGYDSYFVSLGFHGNIISFIIDNIQILIHWSPVSYQSPFTNPVAEAWYMYCMEADAIVAAVVGVISLVLMITAVIRAVKKDYAKTVKSFMGILHLVIIDFIMSVWRLNTKVGVATIVFFAIAFAAILTKIVLNFVFNIKNIVKRVPLKDVFAFIIGAVLSFVIIVLMMNFGAVINISETIETLENSFHYTYDNYGRFMAAYVILQVYTGIVWVCCIALIVLGIKLAKKRFTQLMDLGDCDVEPAAGANKKKKSKTPSLLSIFVWSTIMFVIVFVAAAYPNIDIGLAVGMCAFVFSLGAVIAEGLIEKFFPSDKSAAEEKIK